MSDENKQPKIKISCDYEEKLHLEKPLTIRNRCHTINTNILINTPHLHPKPNNIYVSPLQNHFESIEKRNNISIIQSLLSTKGPNSFSCPNSDNEEINNKQNYDDDSSLENGFQLSFESNEIDDEEDKKEKEENEESKIKMFRKSFKEERIGTRKLSKEYENILNSENNKFSLSFEEGKDKRKSIFKKHIEKEFSLQDSGLYNTVNFRHSDINCLKPSNSILRILESTVEEKKLINSIKLQKLRMSAKI